MAWQPTSSLNRFFAAVALPFAGGALCRRSATGTLFCTACRESPTHAVILARTTAPKPRNRFMESLRSTCRAGKRVPGMTIYPSFAN
ncbi:MAG: hypothetical protein ABSD59_07820 [Terracidiphilus sp.]